MRQSIIDYLNSYIQMNNSWIKISSPINADSKGLIIGSLVIHYKSLDLPFEVEVQASFPFNHIVQQTEALRFIFHKEEGLVHQNFDNSICLHTDATWDTELKIANTFEKLKEWIQRYYINREPDDSPNLLLVSSDTSDGYALNFCYSDSNYSFKKGDHGGLDFLNVGRYRYNTSRENLTYVIQCLHIGKMKIPFKWSNYILQNKSSGKGIWIYVEDEPTKINNKIATTWDDLQKYLNPSHAKLIDTVNKDKTFFSLPGDNALLFFGYKSKIGEIHWEGITFKQSDNFINVHKGGSSFLNYPIQYRKSLNCSYQHFFGRGKLCDDITNARICLIGVGAIGSNLAEILCRGGVKKITFADFDEISAGNPCRSNFNYTAIGESKLHRLTYQLYQISPHVDLDFLSQFFFVKAPKSSKAFLNEKNILNGYDLVINCTGEDEISFLLQEMNLDNAVIDISITNEARELLFITGGHIFDRIKSVADRLDKSSSTLFQPIGCFSPTFKASYNDIIALLSYAVKKANSLMSKKMPLKSFLIKSNEDETSQGLKYEEICYP